MKKRFLAMMLVLALLFAIALTGCSKPVETTTTAAPVAKVVVGMITDTGGLGDESFNDSAYAGLKKAETDFGTEVKVLESASADDYGPNLSAFAEEKLNLIVSVGFLMADATKAAAEQFPEQKFAIIDDSSIDLPNVAGLTFKEQEGSFLVGVIAGLTTKSDVIGFVGGMQFPLIEKFQYGFEAGVKAVNPTAKVLVNYTGSFGDPALGKEAALAQRQLGADVVYHASGACGIGVIQAAGEQNFWAIGVDMDQSALDPKHVLASMIKRVDNATYTVTKSIVEGTFDGSNVEFGLAQEGVGYSDNAGNVPADVAARVEKYREMIIDGTIIVPVDKVSFDAFEMPTAKIKVGMITDTGGLGDESFNDSAYLGLTRAKESFGAEVKVLESASADDYGPNLSAFAEEKLDLIVSVGFLMADATKAAAEQFPNQKFAIIDDGSIDLPNVAGLTFKEQEGSFLVGVIAGLNTKSNVIGFVGGMQFPLIEKFQYGFEAGVKSVNPAAKVLVNYTGSFGDPALGKEAALAQRQLGADVIYHASGACGIGVIQAAGEQNFWAIGVDMDQSALDPKHVLASMIKRVDNATFLASKSVAQGTFDGSNIEFGLAQDGVGYSDNAGNVKPEIAAKAELYKTAIIDGKFVVPYDKATFDAFVVPGL